MSNTKWLARLSIHGVEAREVLRETEKCVWVKGWRGKEERHAKISSYERYFDTFEEAKKYLVEIAAAKIRSAEWSLAYARKVFKDVNNLQEPSP